MAQHNTFTCLFGACSWLGLIAFEIAFPKSLISSKSEFKVKSSGVWELVDVVVLQPLASDCSVWKWSSDGTYSASYTYGAFFTGSASLLGAKEIYLVRDCPTTRQVLFLARLAREARTAEPRPQH
jgi:hypothetical protein